MRDSVISNGPILVSKMNPFYLLINKKNIICYIVLSAPNKCMYAPKLMQRIFNKHSKPFCGVMFTEFL